jgi:FO synthase subunit 1
MGESAEERIKSLAAIARIHRRYGHVQEIILQRYAPPNGRHTPAAAPIALDEILELVTFVHREMPGVHVQFPPNLDHRWIVMLRMGFDDLGGIGLGEDAVNPDYFWPPVDELKQTLQKAGFCLKKRLPLYPEFNDRGWRSERVGRVIRDIAAHERDYRHYSE